MHPPLSDSLISFVITVNIDCNGGLETALKCATLVPDDRA